MISRKTCLVSTVLLTVYLGLSCGEGDGSDDPRNWPTVQEMTDEDKQEIKNVLEDFLPALADLDFKDMQKYATKSMAQEIERWEEDIDVVKKEEFYLKSIEITDIRLGDWDIELVEASHYSLDEHMPEDGWRNTVANARALPLYHVKMVAKIEGEKQEMEKDVHDSFKLIRMDNEWLISTWEGPLLE